MDEFDYLKTTVRHRDGATLETRLDELEQRAKLLARLNYPKKRAEQRLRQNLGWEYERLGDAAVAKKLAAVINEAYAGAGKRGDDAPKKKATRSK